MRFSSYVIISSSTCLCDYYCLFIHVAFTIWLFDSRSYVCHGSSPVYCLVSCPGCCTVALGSLLCSIHAIKFAQLLLHPLAPPFPPVSLLRCFIQPAVHVSITRYCYRDRRFVWYWCYHLFQSWLFTFTGKWCNSIE